MDWRALLVNHKQRPNKKNAPHAAIVPSRVDASSPMAFASRVLGKANTIPSSLKQPRAHDMNDFDRRQTTPTVPPPQPPPLSHTAENDTVAMAVDASTTSSSPPPPLQYKPSDLFISEEDVVAVSLPMLSTLQLLPSTTPVTATPPSPIAVQYPKSIALRIAHVSRLLRVALHQCSQTLRRWSISNSTTLQFNPDAFYKPGQAAERFQRQWLGTTMCLHEHDATFWTSQFTHMYTFHYLLYRKWCQVQAHLQRTLIAPPPLSLSQQPSRNSKLERARQRQTLAEIESCLEQQEAHFYAKMWRYATCYDETDARRSLGASACVRKHNDNAVGHIQCWVSPSGTGASDLLQTVYGEAFSDTIDMVSIDFMSMPTLSLHSIDTLLAQLSQQWLADHFCRCKVPTSSSPSTVISNANVNQEEENNGDSSLSSSSPLATHFVRTRIVVVPQLDVLLADHHKSSSSGARNESVTRHLDDRTLDAIAHSIFRFLTNPAWQHCQVPIVFWLTLHNQNGFRIRQLLRAIHHYTYLSTPTSMDVEMSDNGGAAGKEKDGDRPLVYFHTPIDEDDAVAMRREWLVRWMQCDLQRRRLGEWRHQMPSSSTASNVDDSVARWSSLMVRQRWHAMSLQYLLQWVDDVCNPTRWLHHHDTKDSGSIQTILLRLVTERCGGHMTSSSGTSASTTHGGANNMSAWLQQFNWSCIQRLESANPWAMMSSDDNRENTAIHTPTVNHTSTIASSATTFGLQWFCTAVTQVLMPLTYECHFHLTTTKQQPLLSSNAASRKRPHASLDYATSVVMKNDDADSVDACTSMPEAKRICTAPLSKEEDEGAESIVHTLRMPFDSNASSSLPPVDNNPALDPWRRALARLPFHQFAEQCRLNWSHLMLREDAYRQSSSSSYNQQRLMACTRRMRSQKRVRTLRDAQEHAQLIGIHEIVRLNNVMALIHDLRDASYRQRYSYGDMWRAFQSDPACDLEDGDDALFGIVMLNAFFRDAQFSVSTFQMQTASRQHQQPTSSWRVTMTPEAQMVWIGKRVQWIRTTSGGSSNSNKPPTPSTNNRTMLPSSPPLPPPPSLGSNWGGLVVEDWRALKRTYRPTLDSLDAVRRTPDFLQQNASMALSLEYL